MLTEGVDGLCWEVTWGAQGDPPVAVCTARMEQKSSRLLLSWGDFTQLLWCVATSGWGLGWGDGLKGRGPTVNPWSCTHGNILILAWQAATSYTCRTPFPFCWCEQGLTLEITSGWCCSSPVTWHLGTLYGCMGQLCSPPRPQPGSFFTQLGPNFARLVFSWMSHCVVTRKG